jgi:hypothetical protein
MHGNLYHIFSLEISFLIHSVKVDENVDDIGWYGNFSVVHN